MADRIKGITIQIGGDTTGLNKALAGTNKEIRDTQSQLKDVERLLKLDPTNTTLLEQKQRLLADAIEETKNKLDTLKQAEKQAQEQFKRGDISQKQYDSLQREIEATAIQLKKVESEANKASGSIADINDQPVEDVAGAAKKAENALEDVGDEASNFGDYLKAGAIVEGVKSISGAISDLYDTTQEYRKIMGTLETSSQAAGYTAEETSFAYSQLYGALGDDQTAATALANLQAMGLSQDDLLKMIDLTTGAWASYGDSIPIDGLAESINETVRSGQVTGTFADVLNWGTKEGETFGVMLKDNTEANKEWNDAVKDAETAEDYFNLALQDAGSEAERANIIMQAMASQGLADTADAWYQNNKDMVAANESQLDFMDGASEMSERVAPIMQAVQDGGNDLLNTFLELTENVDFDAIADSIGRVFEAVSNVITFVIENKDAVMGVLTAIAGGIAGLKLASFVQTLGSVASGATSAASAFPKLSSAIGALSNPVFAIASAITGLVYLIGTKGDEIQAILQKVDDFLQNVFATDWSESLGVIGDITNGLFSAIKGVWDGIMGIFNGIIDFIRGVFTGDWERAWDGIKGIFEGIWNSLVGVVKAPINAIIGLINGVIDAINWIIDGINSISFDMPDFLGGAHIGFNLGKIGKIPYLAKGGTVLSGSAVVGEAGPELLTVGPNGTRVQPLTNQNGGNTSTYLGGVNITVYGAPGQDVNDLADMIMDKMQTVAMQKEAVFGA